MTFSDLTPDVCAMVVDDRTSNVIYCTEWSRVNDMPLKVYTDMLDDALNSVNVPALLLDDKVAKSYLD